MFGLTLILILIVMGGIIAFWGDRIGTRVGKKRLSLWGLRPRYTSIIVTIITGVLIAGSTLGILTLTSFDVRTALFGMEALKKQTIELNQEVVRRTQELEKARQELLDKNREYTETNQKIKEIGEQLQRLQRDKLELDARLAALNSETAALNTEKASLQKDVDRLNEITANLRKGIEVIREGTVVVRAGEVVFAGVLNGGQTKSETRRQLESFFQVANQQLLERFGVKDKTLSALFIPQAHVEELVDFIQTKPESIGLRLRSVGNVVEGEPVIGQVELFPNRLVYQKGAHILLNTLTFSGNPQEAEQTITLFLRNVNQAATEQGVLRDPIQGTVGTLPVEKYIEAVNQLRKLSGRIELIAVAKQDTHSAGPLLIDLIVRQAQ